MTTFNPVDHPLCYAHPLRLAISSWIGHVPFAMYLVDVLRPRTIVELGTHYGVSYCAFCQAVKELRLDTRCYAIDTWVGDAQTMFYGPEVLRDLKEHHDPLYGGFSRLIESTFEEAVTQFEDGSIDLLHIDGYHTYDAVKHDFETWLPKLSQRGVVLLHDINVREREFGVWKLWQELTLRYPNFVFTHTHGLGVLAVGQQSAEPLQELLKALPEEQIRIREFFSQLGRRLEVIQELRTLRQTTQDQAAAYEVQLAASGDTSLADELRLLLESDDGEAALIRNVLSQLRERLRSRSLRQSANGEQGAKLAEVFLQLQTANDELREKEALIKSLIDELGVAEKENEKSRWDANQLSAELNQMSARLNYLSDKESRLNAILNSNAWRWVSRYGRIKNRFITPAYRLIKPESEDTSVKPTSTDEYRKWVDEYDTLTDSDRQAIRVRIENLKYQPLISVIMPVYDVDEQWLRAAIESVRRQIYSNWQLCIADDASHKPHVRTVLEEYTAMDPRIKVVFRAQNGHISAASNSALELATGEFAVLLDHDDEIPEHALYLVVEELNAHPETDLIYSDEDKIGEMGERCGPHFKPEYSPDLLYSYNMISHLGVYRTSIVKKIGGFREGYEGSQDYDLALRVIEQIPTSHIRHIPHVLYHWRAIPGSVAMDPYQKEYPHEAARNAIRSHLKRMEIQAFVTQGHGFYHRVTYPVPNPAPLVSFIMGIRDRVDLLRSAVGGLLDQTYYQPVELIIVNNQSHDPATLAFLREIEKDERVKVIDYDAPFNFAAINNLAVKQSKGEIVCLINNDIKVISPDWLKEMVSHALRPEIGAVGAKLYYPNNKVQHAGIILGVSGIAEHAHRRFSREIVGYVARTHVLQNFSAVTGACMVLRRQVFDEVGGMDEVNLAVAFNDIDFCLRIQERGYRILWTPYAELYHVESASRGFGDIERISRRFRNEISYMNMKWGHVIANDPYYSPNLTVKGGDFSLAFPPRAPKPWLKSESHR